MKDCEYKGERPKFRGFRVHGFGAALNPPSHQVLRSCYDAGKLAVIGGGGGGARTFVTLSGLKA